MSAREEWERALEGFQRYLRTAPGETGRPRTDGTRAAYLSHVTALSFAADTGPWRVKSTAVRQLLRRYSAQSRPGVEAGLRAFYAWALMEGRTASSPIRGVEALQGWATVLEEFQEHLAAVDERGRVLSPSVQAAYLGHVRALSRAVDVGPWEVGRGQVDEVIDGYSVTTGRLVRSALRAFYRWGVDTGLTIEPPIRCKLAPAAWDPVIEQFRGHLATAPGSGGEPRSVNTQKAYLFSVVALSLTVDCGPWDVCPDQVESLLQARTPGTAANMIVGLRTFYAWAMEEGFATSTPVPGGPMSPAWHVALVEWRRDLDRKGVTSSGRTNPARFLRWLARASAAGPWEVTGEQLDLWLGEGAWEPQTRRSLVEALRQFYAWGVARGYVERAPGAGVRPGMWLEEHLDPLGPGWREALEAYDADLQASPRRRTNAGVLTSAARDGYLKHLRWLGQSVDVGPWDIGVRHLDRWLSTQNWTRETRRKVLVTLRDFYAWGVRAGHVEWAPVAGLQSAQGETRGPERLGFSPAWEEPAWAFLTWLRAAKRVEGTIEQRRLWLRKLSEVAADPWSVTTGQLAMWLANPDWSAATTRMAKSSVSLFYRWALREGRVTEDPTVRLDTVRVPRGLPRPIPTDVLRAALAASDNRTRLMLKLAAGAGLRRAEIARVHTRDISEAEILVEGKGGHFRRVTMHPDLWEEICAELRRRRDQRPAKGWCDTFTSETGYLFPSDLGPQPLTPEHVGKLAAAVLPAPWTLHTLRHRFATQAYAPERDGIAVQQLLGHAKLETTQIYTQVPDGALRTAVLGVSF